MKQPLTTNIKHTHSQCVLSETRLSCLSCKVSRHLTADMPELPCHIHSVGGLNGVRGQGCLLSC